MAMSAIGAKRTFGETQKMPWASFARRPRQVGALFAGDRAVLARRLGHDALGGVGDAVADAILEPPMMKQLSARTEMRCADGFGGLTDAAVQHPAITGP